jgi:hypothetical protein
MKSMFQMFDKVRVTQGKKTLKEGIIVGLTNCGAKVYDGEAVPPFADSVFHAEWFPFESAERQIRMIRPNRRVRN